MAEPPMAFDLAQQLKANTAFFNNLFNSSVGPLLKAQADLLSGIETTFPDWLRRRHDAHRGRHRPGGDAHAGTFGAAGLGSADWGARGEIPTHAALGQT